MTYTQLAVLGVVAVVVLDLLVVRTRLLDGAPSGRRTPSWCSSSS